MNGSYQFENLEGRESEAKFLAERANLRLGGFKDLLIRHGFPSRGNILEVGAAQGIRTRIIAEQFPETTVVGLDRSAELLTTAIAANRDVTNLTFKHGDLYDSPFPKDSFDFIYARLVFMHLSNPTAALKNLKRLLRPGGRLLIEDADRDCMFFEPAPPSFSNFWKRVQAGQRRLGGNPNIGRMLAPLLRETGFQNVQVETQPIIGGGDEIQFLARTLMPSLNVYLEAGERAEGLEAIDDLHKLGQNPNASFYHFWFVASGEKA